MDEIGYKSIYICAKIVSLTCCDIKAGYLTWTALTPHGKIRQTIAVCQGGNSQNFLSKFIRFFETLWCFYGVGIHRK